MVCTDAETVEIQEIVGAAAAAGLCSSALNVSKLGAVKAALAYTYSLSLDANTKADSTAHGLDVGFLLTSSYLVFMMQAGFALVCAGSVRTKNTLNILLKNILDACVAAVAFYVVGYGFAFGSRDTPNGWIGNWDFGLSATRHTFDWQSFVFQWSFCAAAATIVSGAMAERCYFHAYIGYSVFIAAFVYPVIVHWMWSPDGWLHASASRPASQRILHQGAIDFAGSGVVHMTGGVSALWGAMLIGPRIGRFARDGTALPMRGHSATLVCLGAFLLWFGWYGFNPGSQLKVSGSNAPIVARVAVTTTLGAGSAGISAFFFVCWREKEWNVTNVANGILSGLVSITAGCSVIEPWAALIAGTAGGVLFVVADRLLLKAGLDDPVSAVAIHAVCGAWGLLVPGLFAYYKYVEEVYGGDRAPVKDFQGLFYGGHGQILLCNCIEIVAISTWCSLTMGGYFYIVKLLGLLRVPPEDELWGLDMAKHGGSAYPGEDHFSQLDMEMPGMTITGVHGGLRPQLAARASVRPV